MADELDRVRISAAELRAGASNLVNHEESLRDVREEKRSQRQRERKRPDLQRYQPTPGQSHRQRDGGETAKQAQEPDLPEIAGDFSPAADTKMEADANVHPGNSVSDSGVRDGDCCRDASRGNGQADAPKSLGADRGQLSGAGCVGTGNPRASKAGSDLGNRQDSVHRVRADSSGSGGQQQDCSDSVTNASVGASQSPKPARRVRKPDREIYQPGGRRSQPPAQSAKDTGSCREPERAAKEELKRDCQPFKGEREREDPAGGKPREGRARAKSAKEAEQRKQEQKAEQGRGKKESSDASAAQDPGAATESLPGRLGRLNICAPAGGEAEGKRGAGGAGTEEAGGGRRKGGPEGKRNRAGGGGMQGGEESAEKAERKGRGGRKSRGGEREADREPKKRGGGGDRDRTNGAGERHGRTGG
ncbi:hypothetical protein COCON_G00078010 [Conger conger]|uniref:Uncharacterized protein n=1 Tax=Conger conger TaxID=82655 RepID=A0A9Q1I0L5_CONCO|nr:hypothetical protein COCON_G00078010 [Conger conger]